MSSFAFTCGLVAVSGVWRIICSFVYVHKLEMHFPTSQSIDNLLKAAGEATRLRILNLLRGGSVCVCDLQLALRLPQPTVSRHLSLLRHVGLVVDKRHSNRILYSLVPATTPQLKALLQLIEALSSCEKILEEDIVALAKVLEKGPPKKRRKFSQE